MNAATTVSYYVVRVYDTTGGKLAVYAERDPEGRKVCHAGKRPAFDAAARMGGRQSGYVVLAACHDENGAPCGVSYPPGDGV